MITKDFDTYEVSCDFCATGAMEVLAIDFKDAVSKIKEDCWTVIYDNGTFKHKCPDCAGE